MDKGKEDKPGDFKVKGGSKAKKAAPDISGLWKASPTKIPRAKARSRGRSAALPMFQPPKVNWNILSIAASAILVLVLGVWANSLWGGLVFNDHKIFSELARAQNDNYFWMDLFARAVSHPYAEQAWPLATCMFDGLSFVWTAAWSHLVNVFLHYCACMWLMAVVFRLCWVWHNEKRITLNPYVASITVAALYAVHPLATGSISYITGRSAPLCAMNYFAALFFYASGLLSETTFLAMSMCFIAIAFTLMAVVCNCAAMTIPLAAMAIMLLLRPADTKWSDWLLKHPTGRPFELITYIMLAVSLMILLITGAYPNVNNGTGLATLPLGEYYASQGKTFITYLSRCLVLPFGLSIDPPWVVAHAFTDPLALAGGVALIAVIISLFALKMNLLMRLGCALFVLGLLPATAIPQSEIVSDQRYYIVLAGFCIIVAAALSRFYQVKQRQAITAFCVIVMVWSGFTVWRTHDWRSDLSLWEQAVALNSASPRAHTFYSRALQLADKSDEAKKQAELAVSMDPNYPPAIAALGEADLAERKFAAAVPQLERAGALGLKLGYKPQDLLAIKIDLANAYNGARMYDKALSTAREAEFTDPYNVGLHMTLGKAYLGLKQYDMSLRELEQGWQYTEEKDPTFLPPIAETMYAQGGGENIAKAYQVAHRAVMKLSTREAKIIMAKTALSMDYANEAYMHLQDWVKLHPNDAEAQYIISLAMEKRKETKDAAEHRAMALKEDPSVTKWVVIKDPNEAPAPATPPSPAVSRAPRPGAGQAMPGAPLPGAGQAPPGAPHPGAGQAMPGARRPGAGQAIPGAPHPGAGQAMPGAPRPGAGQAMHGSAQPSAVPIKPGTDNAPAAVHVNQPASTQPATPPLPPGTAPAKH